MLTQATSPANVACVNIFCYAKKVHSMTTSPADLPLQSSSRNAGILAFFSVVLLVFVRAISERGMMNEHGPDAQMGIWFMFMLVQVGLWLLGGLLLCGLFIAFGHHRWGRHLALVPLLAWGAAIGVSSWKFNEGRRALADARSSSSPQRLEELTDFNGTQAGYELDNRLATNPNASADVLRKLYRRDQQGTLMILSRNPRTPADVLQKLAKNDLQDEWIRKGLRRNPSVPEELRQKIDEFEPGDSKTK